MRSIGLFMVEMCLRSGYYLNSMRHIQSVIEREETGHHDTTGQTTSVFLLILAYQAYTPYIVSYLVLN